MRSAPPHRRQNTMSWSAVRVGTALARCRGPAQPDSHRSGSGGASASQTPLPRRRSGGKRRPPRGAGKVTLRACAGRVPTPTPPNYTSQGSPGRHGPPGRSRPHALILTCGFGSVLVRMRKIETSEKLTKGYGGHAGGAAPDPKRTAEPGRASSSQLGDSGKEACPRGGPRDD